MSLPVSLWPMMRAIAARARAARQLVVLSDYDGTLAPIAASPELAQPDPDAMAALARLARTRDTVVAVLTGRPAAFMQERVPFAHFIAGLHGAELRGPGLSGLDLEPARGDVAVLRERVGALGRVPGVLLEDKGAALAAHTRLASPEDAARALALFEAAAVGLENLELVRGKAVLEARPRGATKATAALAILRAIPDGEPRLVLALGDDVTDEDAFRVLLPPAVTVLVSETPRPTAARMWVSGTSEVARLLGALADVRQEG